MSLDSRRGKHYTGQITAWSGKLWAAFIASPADTPIQLFPDEEAKSVGGELSVQMIWYGYSCTLVPYNFVEELPQGGLKPRKTMQCHYNETNSSYEGIVELDSREEERLFVEGIK